MTMACFNYINKIYINMQWRGRRRNEQLSFLLRFSSGFISKHYIPRKEGATVGRDMSGVASNSSISELAAACCQEEAS